MKYLLTLIPLFVASTLISQSAMDLFSGLLLVVTLVIWIREKEKPWHICEWGAGNGIDVALGLWFSSAGLSFIFSPIENTDWLSRLAGFKWVIVMCLMAWSLTRTGISARVQKPAAALLGFCSTYAILVYLLGRDPINPTYDLAPWAGGHRTGGFLSNAMTFAHVYGVYFCLFAGVGLYGLKNRSKDFYWVFTALLLTGVALLLSFTRGVWLAIFVATLLMGFIYRPKIGAGLTALGALGITGAMQVWPTLKERLSQFSLAGDERAWIWQGHWNIFLDHPWTGVGYTENVRILPEYYLKVGAPEGVIVSHAHNQYLQWLAGTGIIGLLAYLLFIGLFLRLSWQVFRRIPESESFPKGLALGTLGAQVCFLLGGLTEANFEHSKMKYVMLIIWALVLYLAKSYPAKTLPLRP